MPKLPSFQFYPGDWMKDPCLRRCSKAAKGVWIDMICLSFECEDRGTFATHGVPWPDDDIAAAVGGDKEEVLHAIAELLSKGVCSRNASDAIFCRRVVRDEAKRRLCSEAGKRGGGNPALTFKGDDKGESKGVLKGAPKRVSKASSSSSTSTSVNKSTPTKEPLSNSTQPLQDDAQPDWGLVGVRLRGYGLARVTDTIAEAKANGFQAEQILSWLDWLEDPAFPKRKEKIGAGMITERIRQADALHWAPHFGWPPVDTPPVQTGTVISYPDAIGVPGNELHESDKRSFDRLNALFGDQFDRLDDLAVFALMGPQRAKIGEINIDFRRKDPHSRLQFLRILEKRASGKLIHSKDSKRETVSQ